MKLLIRKLFLPLLVKLEEGDGEYIYKKSHRTILLVIGALFLFLATSVAAVGLYFEQLGALMPGIVFTGVGVASLVVACVGSDRAVAKLWSSK